MVVIILSCQIKKERWGRREKRGGGGVGGISATCLPALATAPIAIFPAADALLRHRER